MNLRNRVIKIAVLLGLLGPLPGYIVFAGRNFLDASDLKGSFMQFGYFYVVGAVPVFGWYCFIIGLIAALLHGKLDALGWARSARTSVIMMLGALAAVPVILLGGGVPRGVGLAAVVSSAFWIAAYLMLVYREIRRSA